MMQEVVGVRVNKLSGYRYSHFDKLEDLWLYFQ